VGASCGSAVRENVLKIHNSRGIHYAYVARSPKTGLRGEGRRSLEQLMEGECRQRAKGRKNHTRSSISAIDGFAFFRHWARVSFSIYGETMKHRDTVPLSIS
jgi:hypothetical protein